MFRTVQFAYRGVQFEWDPYKAASNLAKHGVAFETASEAFLDPFRRVVDASGPGEARDAVIGFTESQLLLTVVHLTHHEEIIRIISARRASREERRLYEQH